MEWETNAQWSAVMGDNGPWVRHLAKAWQAAATEAPDPPVPERPPSGADLDERIAYWAPLLHLLIYGLGWTRPDLGLARWRENGRPIDDPILRVVDRWWGDEGIVDFLSWAARSGGVSMRLAPYTEPEARAVLATDHRLRDTAEYERRRHTREWNEVWGGGSDPMHLTHHLASPLVYPDRTTRFTSTNGP